ncbi:protein NATD1-like [Anopheles bellator]|uniref:protein NATD1-like n=1 Tax=Anopheles bellator TaxID=139047 RepID=UPI002648A585|nr:protein NATD1-like [Anopheles bellator]
MSCVLFGRVLTSRMRSVRMCSDLQKVSNDPKRSMFYINLGGDSVAYLQYAIDSKQNVITFHHTFVPDAGKGKGVGKQLTQAAFEYAIAQRMNIKLECDFTVKYFKDNEANYSAYVLK